MVAPEPWNRAAVVFARSSIACISRRERKRTIIGCASFIPRRAISSRYGAATGSENRGSRGGEVVGDREVDEVALDRDQPRRQLGQEALGGIGRERVQRKVVLGFGRAQQGDLVGERAPPRERRVDRDQPGDAGAQQPEAQQRLQRQDQPQRLRRRRDIAEPQRGEGHQRDVERVHEVRTPRPRRPRQSGSCRACEARRPAPTRARAGRPTSRSP